MSATFPKHLTSFDPVSGTYKPRLVKISMSGEVVPFYYLLNKNGTIGSIAPRNFKGEILAKEHKQRADPRYPLVQQITPA